MFALILRLFTLLHEIYILINFIDEPSQKNFLIIVFFYNYYIFGYVWTLYISLLFGGLFAINYQQQFFVLSSELHNKYITRWKTPLVDSIVVNSKYYSKQMWLLYNHPQCCQYRIIIKQIGDYLTAICYHVIMLIYKSLTENQTQITVQCPKLRQYLSAWYQIIPNLNISHYFHKKLM